MASGAGAFFGAAYGFVRPALPGSRSLPVLSMHSLRESPFERS
jgi:hypothetical protein